MKVYIITSGEYSDYHIEGVFLDKKKAEAFSKKASTDHYGANYDIEEFDTDDEMDMSRLPYHVSMYDRKWEVRYEGYEAKNCDVNLFNYSPQISRPIPDGVKPHALNNIIYCNHYFLNDCGDEDIIFKPETFDMYLYAKDQEAALKIAHERLGAIKEIAIAKKFDKDKYYTFPSYQQYEREW